MAEGFLHVLKKYIYDLFNVFRRKWLNLLYMDFKSYFLPNWHSQGYEPCLSHHSYLSTCSKYNIPQTYIWLPAPGKKLKVVSFQQNRPECSSHSFLLCVCLCLTVCVFSSPSDWFMNGNYLIIIVTVCIILPLTLMKHLGTSFNPITLNIPQRDAFESWAQ